MSQSGMEYNPHHELLVMLAGALKRGMRLGSSWGLPNHLRILTWVLCRDCQGRGEEMHAGGHTCACREGHKRPPAMHPTALAILQACAMTWVTRPSHTCLSMRFCPDWAPGPIGGSALSSFWEHLPSSDPVFGAARRAWGCAC